MSDAGFLADPSLYGSLGKAVVHEWAKLRWGVFEEHGYPGDQQFPLFFYKVFSLGNKTLELSYFIALCLLRRSTPRVGRGRC